jgi:hypothetical protein
VRKQTGDWAPDPRPACAWCCPVKWQVCPYKVAEMGKRYCEKHADLEGAAA